MSPYKVKKEAKAPSNTHANPSKPVNKPKPEEVTTPTGDGSKVKTDGSEEEKKEEPTFTPPGQMDSETEAKLVTVPVFIPITQIMQNWKVYLVKALNWPADSRWEDIIDTTIYRYALSLDPPVVLQSWYVGDKAAVSPKPAPEKASIKSGGNGHQMVDINSTEFKKLMAGIIVEMINDVQIGKLEI